MKLIIVGLFLLLVTSIYAESMDVINYQIVNDNYISAINADGSVSTIPVNLKNNDYLDYLKWVNGGNKANDVKTPLPFDRTKLTRDWIVAHPPYPSWTLDANYIWQPPVAKPKGKVAIWDELTQEWVIQIQPEVIK